MGSDCEARAAEVRRGQEEGESEDGGEEEDDQGHPRLVAEGEEQTKERGAERIKRLRKVSVAVDQGEGRLGQVQAREGEDEDPGAEETARLPTGRSEGKEGDGVEGAERTGAGVRGKAEKGNPGGEGEGSGEEED